MTQPADAARIITFRLGADLFATDIISVERVLRYEPPRAIPNVPSWIAGVIEFQGRVVPVIDLRRRFELAETATGPHTRVLVFVASEEYVAAIVDAVLDVRVLLQSEMAAAPAIFRGLSGELLRGLTRRQGNLVVVLDTDRLLSSQERLALEPALRDFADV